MTPDPVRRSRQGMPGRVLTAGIPAICAEHRDRFTSVAFAELPERFGLSPSPHHPTTNAAIGLNVLEFA